MAKKTDSTSKGRAAKGARETADKKAKKEATEKKGKSGKRVVLASGRSGSYEPLATPSYPGWTLSGGRLFGTRRMITEEGEKYPSTADSGTERVTVRSGKNSSRTYTTKGKYAK